MSLRNRISRARVTAGLLALLAAAQTSAAPSGWAGDVHALGYSPAHMDRRVSPRQDFYRYAIGNWLANTPIPASATDIGGFSELAVSIDAQLVRLIQQAADSAAEAGTPRQQVGDYWLAAMDLQRLDVLGLAPLQADLQRLASLPLRDAAALGEFSARLQRDYGASPLLNLAVEPDAKDSKRYLLNVLGGLQTLNPDEYLKPEGQPMRDLYKAHMVRMFEAAGDATPAAEAAARSVLAIEAELAAAQMSPIQRLNQSLIYNLRSPAEAQLLLPALDLAALFKTHGISAPAQLQVRDLGAVRALNKVLTERPADEVRHLLRWHLLTARASLLGQPWRDLDAAFTRQREGRPSDPPRERSLAKEISLQLFHPLSRLYVQAYFPDSTRQAVIAMVADIRSEFEQRLRSNPWLDEPTRAAALDKLAKVDIQVGYPQRWVDFSSVVIRKDDYFGNAQRLSAFGLQRDLARLGQPVENERFATPPYTTPTSINAAYNPQSNSIDITAAIVQPPFFMPGADAAVNYCTMGAVIGHELTHGFDSNGRQFGPAGNLRDWWTVQASERFKQRTDVLMQQYSGFMLLPGLRHNGALTLTENTADLGGITLAHAALQRSLRGKPQPPIDGLSTDQRCFVAWAQLWSYRARPERIRLLATTDYHANSVLRGYAPLLHLDAFHMAFGTRPGDPMWRAPKDRVTIW